MYFLLQCAELQADRMRLQAAADAAEAIFHHVRFASGVPAGYSCSSDPTHINSTIACSKDVDIFEQGLDPESIIERFAALEDDVCAVRCVL